MSDEHAGALERLAVAVGSTNLSLREGKRGDVDYIVALGFASRRAHPAAGALMRLHFAGNKETVRQALSAVQKIATRMNAARNWRLSRENLDNAAAVALAHHINPVCPCCHGRGFDLIPGTPKLSARACDFCGGTGARPIQKKNRRQIGEILTALEGIDQITERAVSRSMR